MGQFPWIAAAILLGFLALPKIKRYMVVKKEINLFERLMGQ